MGFDSYHWQEFSLSDPQLAEHRVKLASGRGGPEDFLALLHSGDPVAVGVALDHYKQAEALTRFGDSRSPYSEYDGVVRETARRVLAEPPYPARDGGESEPGLSHASALLALSHVATAEDSDHIADVLRTRPCPAVMNAAGQAAARALTASREPSGDLIGVLGAVLLDESRRTRDRLDALGALRYVKDERIGDILVRAGRTRDEKVQAEVVAVLVGNHLATHLDATKKITETWSPNPSRIQGRILRALEAAERDFHRDQDASSRQGQTGWEKT
ncbi:hypothetical protein QWJ26_30070 [Streptomyces sp. CSDS2]|uniref:hypothetical protein n=1 Tax=Streptomyces sp. CSDS2 TaxID=3055051 RepID=UPI0025B18B31|nr:hypothetical protein [Streptomyces sp. CSDS2]MDN3263984.1 hypothetical protein [Streptomyces sp. CSDS2]